MDNKRIPLKEWCPTLPLLLQEENRFKTLFTAIAVGGSAYLVYKALLADKQPEEMAGKTTIDLQNQSILLPGDERIRACPLDDSLPLTCDENIKTLHDLFQMAYEKYGSNQYLGRRESDDAAYRWITYNDVQKRSAGVGSAIIKLGLKPKSLIGMCAANKPEWTIVEHGFVPYSFISVPLYETLGKEGITHILGQTEIQLIFCDANKVEKLLDHGASLGHLKWMVLFTEPDDAARNKAKEAGVELFNFEEFMESGQKDIQPLALPEPEDISSICYTSGTTGNPKGVVLTHRCHIASISSAISGMVDAGVPIKETDCLISFLPLSHAYERMMELFLTWCGARIGYFRGDITKLVNDIQALQPTLFPTVPRLLNALHDKIMAAVNESKIKSFLFRRALSSKTELLKKGIYRRDTIWDKLVFRKIQNLLGGKVRMVITASAPLSAAVVIFAKCAFGCPVLEGYGQTESCGAASLTNAYDMVVGHVGCPVSCFHIKLCDVPELGYLAKDDYGEICVKGPAMCSGYYKEPEKTKETIDEDGWLHTGDIGRWLPTGVLQIVDRKKHIFKLSQEHPVSAEIINDQYQGEYVAPEKIELVYGKSQYVTHVFVIGDSFRSFIVGIVSPDEEVLMSWAKKQKIDGTFEELCKKEEVNALILDDMIQVGKRENLCSFEQVKMIHLDHQPFTIENELLTPTMKKKRPQIKSRYKAIIEEMYSKMDQIPTKSKVFQNTDLNSQSQ